MMWRGVGTAARVGTRAARGTTRAAATMQQRGRISALTRGPRSGVLGPGDGPAPPGVDLFDYRGVGPPGTFLGEGLPLGQAIDVRTNRRSPAALPFHLVFRHAAVFGPPGSGKTTGVVVPWAISLLERGASVFAIDVKGNLLQEITAAMAGRPSLGARVWSWDSTRPTTHRWNFLGGIASERAIEAATLSILGRQLPADPQPYFYQRDYRWLKGLLRLATALRAGADVHPADLVTLLGDATRLSALIAARSGAQIAADLGDLAGLPPDDYSRSISGLLNALSVFQQPSVQRATAASDIDLAEIWTVPTLVVCVARLSDARLAEQMSSLMVSQLSTLVLDGFGTQRARPLVLMLDEAPRLKDRVDLEALLAMVRGADTGICLAAQDVTQFGPPEKYEPLLANCQTVISMYGSSDATAAFLAKRLGNRLAEQVSISDPPQRGVFAAPSATTSSASVPVLGHREIMYPPFGPYSAITHVPAVCAQPVVCDFEQP
jgi:type IV secretory pathway TraG/TraD family ATPase VirD4